ncbi:unnamed protein product [Symbiodinium sp. CCMP2592]|nr:unnamed protein product [Symbiodinium sp. CCMP2592]
MEQDKVHQDDLIGANYDLVKEWFIELGGEATPALADFQDVPAAVHQESEEPRAEDDVDMVNRGLWEFPEDLECDMEILSWCVNVLVHSFVEAVATPIKASAATSLGAAGAFAAGSTPPTVPDNNRIPELMPVKLCMDPSSVEVGPAVTPMKFRGGSSPGDAGSCAGSTPPTVPFEVVLPTPVKPGVSSSPAPGATPPTVPFNVVLPNSGDCWGTPDVGKSPGPSTAERDAEKDRMPESRLQVKIQVVMNGFASEIMPDRIPIADLPGSLLCAPQRRANLIPDDAVLGLPSFPKWIQKGAAEGAKGVPAPPLSLISEQKAVETVVPDKAETGNQKATSKSKAKAKATASAVTKATAGIKGQSKPAMSLNSKPKASSSKPGREQSKQAYESPVKTKQLGDGATPNKRKKSFLTRSAKKRAEQQARKELAVANIAMLQRLGLEGLSFPEEDFDRQSWTLYGPKAGAKGATNPEETGSIQVVAGRNLFYVSKARIPDGLEPDNKSGATVGFNTFPTVGCGQGNGWLDFPS